MSRVLDAVRDALLAPAEPPAAHVVPPCAPASVAVVGPRDVALAVGCGLAVTLASEAEEAVAVLRAEGFGDPATWAPPARAAARLAPALPGAAVRGRLLCVAADEEPARPGVPAVLVVTGPRTAAVDAAIARCEHVTLAVPPALPGVLVEAAVADLAALGRPVARVTWAPGALRRVLLATGRVALPARLRRLALTPTAGSA